MRKRLRSAMSEGFKWFRASVHSCFCRTLQVSIAFTDSSVRLRAGIHVVLDLVRPLDVAINWKRHHFLPNSNHSTQSDLQSLDRGLMAIQSTRDIELCERLKTLGYAHRNRIRMYGEEFDLISNPIQDENGFAIEAVSRKSGHARMLRIPLSIVQMISKDVAGGLSRRAA